MLELKIASLSKTANNAVKKFSPDASGKDDSDDNEDSSDDDDDASDEEIDAHDIEQPNIGESTIEALVSKISSWTHAQPPTK